MSTNKIDKKIAEDHDQILTTDLGALRNSCFEECSSQNTIGITPIHTECFKNIVKKDVYLHLFSNMIVKTHERNIPTKADSDVEILRFSSDMAFYIKLGNQDSRKFSAIKLVNMNNKLSETFYHLNIKTVNCWAGLLSNYINQIGIQQYFKTIRMLGKGVSAEVHLAQRLIDNKLFAIKVFDKLKNAKKCQDAFENQIKTLRILNHPNIIKLYNVFVSNQFIYAVLEYLPGGTLFEQVKQMQAERRKYQKINEQRVCSNLLSAIEHLRSKRIVHRDLKLENILIRPATNSNEKGYVLCDFGLATWIDQQTYIFQKCGTPGYIAPQILRTQKGQKIKVDCKADIFSLGCIIHVIFLVRSVFHYSGDYKSLLKQNKQCVIDFSAKIYDSLGSDQLELLQSMLIENPKDRLSSDTLIKMSYFRKPKEEPRIPQRAHTLRGIQMDLSRIPKTILRSADRVGSVQVKEQRKATFTRNASLNKNISFTESTPSNKPKSTSIFDFFSRRRFSHTQTLSAPQQVKLKLKAPMSLKRQIVKDMVANT